MSTNDTEVVQTPQKKGTLLVVDDNDLFRRSIGPLLLRLSGSPLDNVLEAASGEEACRLLNTHPVDCILLDYRMPGGDGLFWLRKIISTHPRVAVIMLTGEGDEATAVEAMKAGAMDYIVKESPRENDLLRAIVNAMERMRLQRELEQQREELLQAERQRAMITSLATACHHLGQPATVIMTCLELMQRRETSAEMKEMIRQCLKAAEGIGDILIKLQRVSEYRTVPYLPTEAARGQSDQQILDI